MGLLSLSRPSEMVYVPSKDPRPISRSPCNERSSILSMVQGVFQQVLCFRRAGTGVRSCKECHEPFLPLSIASVDVSRGSCVPFFLLFQLWCLPFLTPWGRFRGKDWVLCRSSPRIAPHLQSSREGAAPATNHPFCCANVRSCGMEKENTSHSNVSRTGMERVPFSTYLVQSTPKRAERKHPVLFLDASFRTSMSESSIPSFFRSVPPSRGKCVSLGSWIPIHGLPSQSV